MITLYDGTIYSPLLTKEESSLAPSFEDNIFTSKPQQQIDFNLPKQSQKAWRPFFQSLAKHCLTYDSAHTELALQFLHSDKTQIPREITSFAHTIFSLKKKEEPVEQSLSKLKSPKLINLIRSSIYPQVRLNKPIYREDPQYAQRGLSTTKIEYSSVQIGEATLFFPSPFNRQLPDSGQELINYLDPAALSRPTLLLVKKAIKQRKYEFLEALFKHPFLNNILAFKTILNFSAEELELDRVFQLAEKYLDPNGTDDEGDILLQSVLYKLEPIFLDRFLKLKNINPLLTNKSNHSILDFVLQAFPATSLQVSEKLLILLLNSKKVCQPPQLLRALRSGAQRIKIDNKTWAYEIFLKNTKINPDHLQDVMEDPDTPIKAALLILESAPEKLYPERSNKEGENLLHRLVQSEDINLIKEYLIGAKSHLLKKVSRKSTTKSGKTPENLTKHLDVGMWLRGKLGPLGL